MNWQKMTLITLSIVLIFVITTIAIGETYEEGWIMCQLDSYVNIRAFPKTNSEQTGYLLAGDRIFLDGQVKNGFAHCVGLSTEAGEGWVYKGFISPSKPVEDGREYHVKANGRVAARRSISGDRRCWLHDNDILTVYLKSEDWCLTSQGFIKAEFINFSDQPVIISEYSNPYDMTWEDD